MKLKINKKKTDIKLTHLMPALFLVDLLIKLNMVFKTLQFYWPAVRVFANGPGDLGSIPGRVIPKI